MTGQSKSQKSGSPVWTSILLLIKDGKYKAQISRILGRSKQIIDYYLKRLEKAGLIEREYKSSFVRYRLTETSQKILTESQRGSLIVCLHNFSMKFPVIKDASMAIDWNKVQMVNWVRLTGKFEGCTVEKTSKSIIIHVKSKVGFDPYVLFFDAVIEGLNLAKQLEDRFGVVFGVPEINRKPHYGVYDPVLEKLNKFLHVSFNRGHSDDSPELGTREHYDPRSIQDYLELPKAVGEMKENVKTVMDTSSGLVSVVTILTQEIPKLRHSINSLSNAITKRFGKDRDRDVLEGS